MGVGSGRWRISSITVSQAVPGEKTRLGSLCVQSPESMREGPACQAKPGRGREGNVLGALGGVGVDPREEVTLTPLAEKESSSKREEEERFVRNMSLSGLPTAKVCRSLGNRKKNINTTGA